VSATLPNYAGKCAIHVYLNGAIISKWRMNGKTDKRLFAIENHYRHEKKLFFLLDQLPFPHSRFMI
jgi:hypothetical protein